MELNNADFVRMFGDEKDLERYLKKNTLEVSAKKKLLKKAKIEYGIVEDLGRGKYFIDNKLGYSMVLSEDKMSHGIYGSLMPSILINVKEHYDRNEVFCLSMNSIYYTFDMINKNYISMKNRKGIASNVLEVNPEVTFEFFESTTKKLSYYLEYSLNYLSSAGLIKYLKIPTVALIEKEIVTTKIKDTGATLTIDRRRATAKENQIIANIRDEVCKKHNIINNGSRLFGEAFEDYHAELKKYNIDYVYDSYEITCLKRDDVDFIIKYYGVNNKTILANSFSNNFINMAMEQVEKNHAKAIENNLLEFYRFNKKYLEDFSKLLNATIPKSTEEIEIEQYKVEKIENGYGGYSISVTETK